MADIKKWQVEDNDFWQTQGKGIANRNLWLSIPSLSCSFAIWLYCSVISIQILIWVFQSLKRICLF